MKRKGKMGVTKWEGVIVGYPIASVGYQVWDPLRGKVYNVGVPHVDEDFQLGWWRKEAEGGVADGFEEIMFPDLGVDKVQVAEHEIPQIAEPLMPDLVEDSNDEEDEIDDASGGDVDE